MEGYTVRYSKRKTLAIKVERTGEVVVCAPYFTSKNQIEKLLFSHGAWIEKAKQRMAKKTVYPTDSLSKEALRKKAESVLPERIAYFSALTALTPRSVGFNFAKTRFGSCSFSGNIHFSCYLMLYPPEAVDYVVLHELAHLKHHNHQKEFYRLIERFMPDYKERIKMLKK